MLQDMIVSSFVAGALGDPDPKDVEAVNGLSSGPLVELKVEDIFVREMRLVGDELTSFFSRFRTPVLSEVAHSTIGKTMLFGHDKSDAGRGRFFRSDVRRLESRSLDGGETAHMTFARFYWPRERSDAEDLRVNIDAGVYHECSLSFQFKKPTCSICGYDIRNYAKCVHWPGRTYRIVSGDGKTREDRLCWYWIDEFVQVMEGSIVYLGAHPNTGFGSLEQRMDSGECAWLREIWEQKGREDRQARRIIVGGREVDRRIEGA